jgi:hypothetical protein
MPVPNAKNVGAGERRPIIERNPNTKKRRYSAKSYIEALKKGLLPYYRRS